MTRNRDVDTGRFSLSLKTSTFLLLNYFIGYISVYPQLALLIFGANGNQLNPKGSMAVTLVTLFISLYLVRDMIKPTFHHFKLRWRENVKTIFNHYVLLMFLNMVFGIVIMKIFGDVEAGNQALLEEGFSQYPVLLAFTAVVFAPIVEEIVFRGVLYQSLRSEKRYIIPTVISSVSFGIIHTLPMYFQTGNVSELAFLLVYSGMGFALVRSYEKSGNIWTSISVHFLNNLIATIAMLSR